MSNGNSLVQHRHNWAKFGACVDGKSGVEDSECGITRRSDQDIFIQWTCTPDERDHDADASTEQDDDLALKRKAAQQVEAVLRVQRLRERLAARKSKASPQISSPTLASGSKYLPPARRHRKSNEVKISNLSLQASEADVEELCTVFGPITRIHVSRDRFTGMPKGHAYVTFASDIHAEKCVRLLDRYGYDHLILSVTWAE